MKQLWIIATILIMVISAYATEIVTYHEDFENGATGWQMIDGSVSPNSWHIYNYGSTQGTVWWMGDPALASGSNIGGYHNHQYLVLDTPARTISAATANLSFKMRLGLEDVGGAGEYDGWDSFNVRISTNNGATWSVISGTPDYHFNSSYAFGSIHGEGTGVPGWGGIVSTWTSASFNLAAYIGQSVKIRFAFASDTAYSTAEQPDMFGVMLDDISLGGYINSGVNDGHMTVSSLVPIGGQLWHVATDTSAPSPAHAMVNQNTNGSYNTNMLNYLISPPITLPDAGGIRADFMLMGSFTDNGTFPNVDYFGWEISPNDGLNWYPMSNPYNDPNGFNYVYNDAPATWSGMIANFSLDGVISDYAGQTVKFRWYFKSNDTANGTGIRIDDFKIFCDLPQSPPENLGGMVIGSNVYLSWDAPGSGGGGGEEGWISYCGENYNSIGTNGAADFSVAAKWDAIGVENSIYPYVGMNITKIRFWPNEAACSYSLRVWAGGSNTLVLDQSVNSPIIGAWNEITLNTPYQIPPATSIMAGYRCNTSTGFPAGLDGNPTVDGYGNMIYMGSWQTLSSLASIDGNWNIQVYVTDAQGREYLLGESPQTINHNAGSLQNTNTARQLRNPNYYNIYRDDIQVATVPGDITEYTDSGVNSGTHSYYVTAVTNGLESPPSATIIVFVAAANLQESAFDDGSAELALTIPSTKQMAVLHDTFSNHHLTLHRAKIYIQNLNLSALIVRVIEENEYTGLPDNLMAQTTVAASNLVQGWNYIQMPSPLVIPSGRFYLGILVATNAHGIGVDTSSGGHSYTNVSGVWAPYDGGEIMIRAIVETQGMMLEIPLVEGWNLCSLNLNPDDNSLPGVFGDISAYVSQVKGTDGIYIPGNPYSSLTNLSEGKAYNIQMTNPATWVVNGNPIPGDSPIPLTDGWNLAGYLPQTPMNVQTAISSIAPWLNQVKGLDGVYIPENPYSSLTTMEPGKGYWIKLDGAHDLIYPQRAGMVSKAPAQNTNAHPKVLPYSMTLLARCNWADAGDILLAKSGNEMRGAQKLTSPEGFPAALIQIYCGDSEEDISLSIQKPDGTIIPVANSLTSQPNGILGSYPNFVELVKGDGTSESPAMQNMLMGTYPNPFNPSTTISFSIAEDDCPVNISIYNLKGQKIQTIADGEFPSGNHRIVWNAEKFGSGLYIISFRAGSYHKTTKAVLTK